jgi:transmembrane sensor
MSSQNERLHELIAEQAAEWYVAQRDGGLGEVRNREFMRWLRKSPAHVAEYLSIAGLAQDMADVARESDTPLEQLLAEAGVNNVIALDGSIIESSANRAPEAGGAHAVKSRAKRRPRTAAPLFGLRHTAVAMTVLLVAGATLWFGVYQPGQYATRHGEQRTLQLPDNTVVRLNSNSAIAVDFDAERRRVEVRRGQVYFEIAQDETRPFNVRAGAHLIQDIGTAFDVYRRGDTVTVTVVEGRVRIWDRELPVSTLEISPEALAERPPPEFSPALLADLDAGNQIRIAKSGKVEKQGPANVQAATAWVQEKIIFDKHPIAEVATEFNRYNRRQIHIADPRVGAIPISGVFRTYDVESFAQFLNRLPGVRAEQTADNIVITAEPPARARQG